VPPERVVAAGEQGVVSGARWRDGLAAAWAIGTVVAYFLLHWRIYARALELAIP
jgi:hypothetical protein